MNVAILGFGTVGSGVYEVLKNNAETVKQKCGEEIKVTHILDVRDFSAHEDADLFTKDYNVVLCDKTVKVIAEVIGGTEPAFDFSKKALMSGKSVVTSNKELVEKHGAELLQIAEENGVHYMFEASVGGGIPVINTMRNCLAANNITEIAGILNGTTNYIMTKMFSEGSTFEEALEDAQNKGYAERNPAADVEGHDACRKIAILTAMATGTLISAEDIETVGISDINKNDVKYAEKINCSIKLIAYSKKENGKIYARVAPTMVPDGVVLKNVNGVYNAISLKCDMADDILIYGRGAGKLPTASAVVGDFVEIARGIGENARIRWIKGTKADLCDAAEQVVRYFAIANGDVDISGAEKVSIGVDGENGYVLPPMKEKEISALKNDSHFIKFIRMF